jgi:hypothetical protein
MIKFLELITNLFNPMLRKKYVIKMHLGPKSPLQGDRGNYPLSSNPGYKVIPPSTNKVVPFT